MTECVKTKLISDLLSEVRENVSVTHTTHYTFAPEQSPHWQVMKASFIRDTSYPYNNYITAESIKEDLLKALSKEYPDSTITCDNSSHLSYTIDWIKPVDLKTKPVEYQGILKTLLAYLP